MPQREGDVDTARPLPFELDLLTPRYEPEHHGIYLDLLDVALDRAEVRNVALTGAYGTGKSSVLVELAKTEKHKTLNVSLSSMGLDPDAELTNQIQKEVVKQILYTVEPAKAPRSRFDRTSRGRWRDGLLLAALVGFVGAMAVTFGWSIASQVRHGFPNPAIAFVVTFLLAGTVTYVVRQMMRGRVSVDQVAAGPANIRLSRTTPTTYFDEYLDEIVYFFEVTRYDLVIFEDIDRFDDTGIFETLRSLNTLLNSAPQLAARPVRFVYAMRDSLFQKLEDDLLEPSSSSEAGADDDGTPTNRQSDVARQDVQRANRTKFFDIVIPVVPFITRENARDVMTRAFREDGYGVSDRLLDIVARHIADMRLVTNVRNEFKVFHHHLVDGPHAVPELDADGLLAVVVYKNVHLQDFERIRFGTSNLDDLYRLGRDLVTNNVEERTERIQELRAALVNQDAAAYRSKALGNRLQLILADLGAQITVPPHNRPAPQEILKSAKFWLDIAAGRSNASMRMPNGSQFPLTPQVVGRLLDEPLTAERWDAEARPQMERELAKLERTVTMLTGATWKRLCAEPTKRTKSGETFAKATRRILGSDLAADLVQHGYLDEYFSLDIAPFYGEQISRNAMRFVQRNVDRGVPDLLYRLSDADVDAVLNDRPNALEDVGIYNVTLLDHLLASYPHRAPTIIANIPRMGAHEVRLLTAYTEHGEHPGAFVETLAPIWPDIMGYLTEDAHVDLARQRDMVDAVLTSWSDDLAYSLGPRARRFVEDNYTELASICGTTASKRAAQLALETGAVFADLGPVADEALPPIKKAGSYPITASNLARATSCSDRPTGLASLSLDNLAAEEPVVHANAIAHLGDYLDATGTMPTVDDPEAFAEVLHSVGDHEAALINSVVARAQAGCVLEDVTDAPPSTWPHVAEHGRFTPSVANLSAYLEDQPVDAPLATLLETSGPVVGWDTSATSTSVVVAIIKARQAIPDPATRIAHVLDAPLARHLTAEEIPDEPTTMLRLLVEHGLVEDTAATFAPSVASDPVAFASAVAVSAQFATFMSPAVVTVERIAALMNDDEVDDAIKSTIITDLSAYLPGAPGVACVAVAEYCLSHGLTLDGSQLGLLAGGVPAPLMVRLLARSDLAADELVPHLRALGGSYAELCERDGRKLQVPDDGAHASILGRFKDASVIKRTRRDGRGHINIWQHG
ncbi:YobI family P-loop NTPase [Isoptericola aurantiacus]|uniref:YobI family P-loop NTPase n=1 Tax=Isoptericola aurantiacus TaxID=3377839 RepID=UPI00383A7694